MGKVVRLTILGLAVAIALDWLYATLSHRPWGIRPAPEMVWLSEETDSGVVELLPVQLETIQQPDGSTVHLIWTTPGESRIKRAIGWFQGSHSLDCESQYPDLPQTFTLQ